MSVEKQIIVILAGTKGFLDDVEISQLEEFQVGLLEFMEASHPDLLKEILEKKALDDDLQKRLQGAIGEYATRFKEERAA